MKEKTDLTNYEVKGILKEFGVNSEDELVDKVEETWYQSMCTICGNPLDLRACAYDDGDPICLGGCRGQR
jgi:hypothetical protein